MNPKRKGDKKDSLFNPFIPTIETFILLTSIMSIMDSLLHSNF